MTDSTADIPGLIADLGDIPVITEATLVAQKSRDFYWYSPVLKRQLDGKVADLVIQPGSEAEVVAAVRACFARNVPVVVRGGGTGNYGQAVPLKRGAILDLGRMTAIKWLKPGAARVEAGLKLSALDKAAQRALGQELRIHPSTHKTGTVGGFVCGGSSGVGSITFGLLRDRGNVAGLRVVTMEAEPRILELRGDDVQKVNHAYGTNGVVTEVEMPLATAWNWADVMVAGPDFMELARFAQALGQHVGILKKLVAPIAAPLPEDYFRPLKEFIPAGHHVALLMIAEQSLEAFDALLAEWPGLAKIYQRTAKDLVGKTPLYEYAWNHTTLQGLKVDRTITYLQILFPPPDHLAKVELAHRTLGDEVPMNLEFVNLGGEIGCFGLPVVRYTTDQRLYEIIDFFEANGCPVFDPHVYTLEDGGMKMVDAAQLAFKREADPRGLMNPGKMVAWDDPDYRADPSRTHLYRIGGGDRAAE